jgi:hypothetical protein
MSVSRLWDRPIRGQTHERNLRRAAIVRAARRLRRAEDRIGEVHGRLTIVDVATPTEDGRTRVRCACSCGGHAVVRISDLVTGGTTSCGCHRRELAVESGRRMGRGNQGRVRGER